MKMGLKDKSESPAMAGSWPGATIIGAERSSPPSPATLSVNVNIKRNPSLKKLLKLPIFGGSGNSGGKSSYVYFVELWEHGSRAL